MTKIIVTVRIPGVHKWPNCDIDEVVYLRDYHRHMFHIKAWKPVTHDDRDVEILRFKKEMKDYLREEYYDVEADVCFFGAMSCEMIAKELAEQFELTECEVLEDGENGATYSQFVDLSHQIDMEDF